MGAVDISRGTVVQPRAALGSLTVRFKITVPQPFRPARAAVAPEGLCYGRPLASMQA